MFEQEHLALRQRQLDLKLRSAELRASLAIQVSLAGPVLSLADRARSAWQGWRQRWDQAAPIWRVLSAALSAAVAIGMLRRRSRLMRVVGLMRRAAGLWALWQAWQASRGAAAPAPAPAETEGEPRPGA